MLLRWNPQTAHQCVSLAKHSLLFEQVVCRTNNLLSKAIVKSLIYWIEIVISGCNLGPRKPFLRIVFLLGFFEQLILFLGYNLSPPCHYHDRSIHKTTLSIVKIIEQYMPMAPLRQTIKIPPNKNRYV